VDYNFICLQLTSFSARSFCFRCSDWLMLAVYSTSI